MIIITANVITTVFVTVILSNRGIFFSVFAKPHRNTRVLQEFKKVMQTPDAVEGLLNFREFFQLPERLGGTM